MLLDLLAQLKLTDVTDGIRSITETLYQELIDAEAAGLIGTGKYERTDERTDERKGSRPRTLSTTAGDLDLAVGAFTARDLSAMGFRYVFLNATYCKARVSHRVVSQAIVVAVGVAADGRREVLGFDVGDTENETF